MFLTLVGLTALGVGGVGASEAVSAFLDRKRFDIAILKSLGADGRLVFLIFFLQVMAIALAALILGVAIGATAPFLLALFLRRQPAAAAGSWAFIPAPLLLAAGFGLLSAIAFSVPPLGRAREIPPASLLRETVAPGSHAPSPRLSARGRRGGPGHRRPDAGPGALAALCAANFWAARSCCWGCCGWWRKA